MTKRFEVYKCEKCGNIVEVLHEAQGRLVCCGQPMNLLEEQTADQATEKHVPVIEKAGSGVKVKVGSVPHPMLDKHYIEWIEVMDDNTVLRRFISPDSVAEVEFDIDEGEIKKAREFCNIHGLWKFEK